MGTETTGLVVHPEGEKPEVEAWSAVADTYAGRVHVEWDASASPARVARYEAASTKLELRSIPVTWQST